MMFVSFILFTTLGIYFDNIVQSQYGTAKHFLYFLDKEYWNPASGSRTKIADNGSKEDTANDQTHEAFYIDKKNYEGAQRPELLN